MDSGREWDFCLGPRDVLVVPLASLGWEVIGARADVSRRLKQLK